MTLPLRAYQRNAIAALTDAVNAGRRRVILRAPTGAGKTRIAREIVDRCVARGSSVVFVAPRAEIIAQVSADLDSAGIDHGILMSNHFRRRPHLRVQVASMLTLMRRTTAAPDVLFLDECHLHLSAAVKLVARFPSSIVIGLTATPARLDGRGLGEIYEQIIPVAETADLIRDGYLVPYRVFRPSTPELAGVRTVAGEFNRRDLGAVMDTARVVGDVVADWHRYAAGQSTIVFACSVDASKRLAAAFGPIATHVDSDTPADERAAIVRRLGDGSLKIACNVELFTYGLDVPRVSCISMARPTKSLALYLQMTGRGLRPFEGKSMLTVIDHAGNTYRHDLPDAVHDWNLDGVTRRGGDRLPSLRTCTSCYAVCAGNVTACPECKTPFPIMPRHVQHVSGALVEVHKRDWNAMAYTGRVTMIKNWFQAGRPPKQILAIYRSMFGHWPPDVEMAAAQAAIKAQAVTR